MKCSFCVHFVSRDNNSVVIFKSLLLRVHTKMFFAQNNICELCFKILKKAAEKVWGKMLLIIVGSSFNFSAFVCV